MGSQHFKFLSNVYTTPSRDFMPGPLTEEKQCSPD